MPRFVELEVPTAASSHLVIELPGGARILLSEPAHVVLLAQLLSSVGENGEGGCP